MRLRCFVVEWEPSKGFPFDKVNEGMTAVFTKHNAPQLTVVVDTWESNCRAIVVSPKPIALRVADHVCGQYLEGNRKNPVEITV